MSLPDRRIGRSPSLWLVPEGPAAVRLTALSASLRAEHGGPRFAPHLTLLGGLSADGLVERTAALAETLPPLTVRITRASWGARWFQCVYLLAERSPPLLAARRLACEALGGSPTVAFLPHISLLYGDLPAPTRAGICRSLGPLPVGFAARELVLVNTVGPTELWTELGRFPLSGSR